MRYPFDGNYPVVSPFGPRAGGFHPGIDFGCPVGTPMLAVADGTVFYRGLEAEAGNHLAVYFDNPPDPSAPKYGYMHLSRFNVNVGDHVAEGQLVGYSGGIEGAPGSGNSTGPHLHFWTGTNANVGAVDPMPFFDGNPPPAPPPEDDTLKLDDEDQKWIHDQIAIGLQQAVNSILHVLVGNHPDDADGLLGVWEDDTRAAVNKHIDEKLAEVVVKLKSG